MKNLVFMANFGGFSLFTRDYGTKLFCYLIPISLCVEKLDIYDLSSYRISSTLALEFLNLSKQNSNEK